MGWRGRQHRRQEDILEGACPRVGLGLGFKGMSIR